MTASMANRARLGKVPRHANDLVLVMSFQQKDGPVAVVPLLSTWLFDPLRYVVCVSAELVRF